MSELLKNNRWLAEKLCVSLQTARTLHLKTDIPVIRFPGSRLCRYKESDIDRWINSQNKQGGKAGNGK